MCIRDSGNTPLVKLRRASEETGCIILGKAEFMNPGHSVKDRAALGIITDAIERGELRPGGLIVEGTAGNTGMASRTRNARAAKAASKKMRKNATHANHTRVAIGKTS